MKASNSPSAKESKRKGLLGALDFDKCSKSRKAEEVEYQLYSWGEIYSPFSGERKHSTAARHILRYFPFKLFSSSLPEGPLPQKLCLTFRAPLETRQKGHLVGNFPHEIAKEFTAFLSLITRRRIFVTKKTRSDGLPIEEEVDLYQHSHFQEKQRDEVVEPKEIKQLLDKLQAMDEHIANGFILAIRLYHSATEMMYTEPEFSYLFLISSLEAISSAVINKKDLIPGGEDDKRDKFWDLEFPEWKGILDTFPSGQKEQIRKLILKRERFTFRKLVRFVEKNAPGRFYNETEDYAKPYDLTVIAEVGPNGSGRQYIDNSFTSLQKWEKIERKGLKPVLRDIYDARSRLIHKGIRLPSYISIGHFRKISVETAAELTAAIIKDKGETSLKIPPLLTFERLVSYSLVEFLRKYENAGV